MYDYYYFQWNLPVIINVKEQNINKDYFCSAKSCITILIDDTLIFIDRWCKGESFAISNQFDVHLFPSLKLHFSRLLRIASQWGLQFRSNYWDKSVRMQWEIVESPHEIYVTNRLAAAAISRRFFFGGLHKKQRALSASSSITRNLCSYYAPGVRGLAWPSRRSPPIFIGCSSDRNCVP